MAIAGNTAQHAGWSGMFESGRVMTERWNDPKETKKEEAKKPEDDRPCGEVAADIWKRMRGQK